MAERYPGLLAGAGEAIVAVVGDELAATAVWRPFTWHDGDRAWPAAMVGCVVTHPRHRGRGLGSAVMDGVRSRLIAHGAQVGVLWAGRHDFYERLGWLPADPGVRCDTSGDAGLPFPREVTTVQPAAGAATDLLAIHRLHATQRVERTAQTYATVPPPGDRVSAHVAGGEAYVLVAARGEQRYVLEFAGAPRHVAVLWDAVRSGPGAIVVNEQRGSAAERHLAEEHGLRFEAQDLALWLPLEPALPRACLATWHIPWIDRI
jgi:GNAT superfamily N-acetyltransferase